MKLLPFIVVLALAAALTACSSQTDSPYVSVPGSELGTEITQQTLTDLAAELKAQYREVLTASSALGEELFNKNCQKLYGFEASELSEAVIVYNASDGLADEVSVIIRADGDSAKALQTLTERIDLRRADFEDYKPAELPKINSAKVFEINGGAVLVISESAEEIGKSVGEKLK